MATFEVNKDELNDEQGLTNFFHSETFKNADNIIFNTRMVDYKNSSNGKGSSWKKVNLICFISLALVKFYNLSNIPLSDKTHILREVSKTDNTLKELETIFENETGKKISFQPNWEIKLQLITQQLSRYKKYPYPPPPYSPDKNFY